MSFDKKDQSSTEIASKLWEVAKARKKVETVEEQELLSLTDKEFKKCTFRIVNQSERLAECQFHTKGMRHGVRLFPPHLYNITEDGKLEYRESQDKPFKPFSPKKRVIDKKAFVN